jgi:hypothetical protein
VRIAGTDTRRETLEGSASTERRISTKRRMLTLRNEMGIVSVDAAAGESGW